jgi:Putative restriction endonuclease
MPHLKKAELIEGVVHMPSPVRLHQHGGPHADFIGWLVFYRANTPGVQVGDNVSIRLDMHNMAQPDSTMLIEPSSGGKVRLSPDDYVVGGPELVGEIAASSAHIDLSTKLHVYRHNQVQEYIVWRMADKVIDWFVLGETQYDPLPLNADGVFKSPVFPGLWLDAHALTRRDMARVFQVLQEGLASPEHARFVASLQNYKNKTS